MDVGGTKLMAVALRGEEVLGAAKVPTPASGLGVLDAIVNLVDDLESAGFLTDALGVGAPGLVDLEGRLRFAPNLADADGLELRAELGSRMGLRRSGLLDRKAGGPSRPDQTMGSQGPDIVIDNDATCATAGELALGAMRGVRDGLMVTLGSGIGGGIVVGGNLFRGAHGFAGEVGHMVIDPGGPMCACGKRGCFETYASGNALAQLAREAAQAGRGAAILERAGGSIESLRGEHVTQAAAEGDSEAEALLARLGWWLGLGLANLAGIFDPQMIVVGGGLAEAGEAVLGPARLAFAELIEGARFRPPIPIVAAALGEKAGAIGAAVVARRSLLRARRAAMTGDG